MVEATRRRSDQSALPHGTKNACTSMRWIVTFRINTRRFFDRRACSSHVQCLQNGGPAIVRLTSGGEGPYFSKLDSSFCQIGPHDFDDHESSCDWY